MWYNGRLVRCFPLGHTPHSHTKVVHKRARAHEHSALKPGTQMYAHTCTQIYTHNRAYTHTYTYPALSLEAELRILASTHRWKLEKVYAEGLGIECAWVGVGHTQTRGWQLEKV